jgi:hypothetical protein
MLLLPEGQTSEAWKPSKKQCCFGNRVALDSKVLSFFEGLIISEGKPAVAVCREQMASSFGVASPHVDQIRRLLRLPEIHSQSRAVCWHCIEACNGVTVTETRETQMSFGAAPWCL